MLEDQKEIIDGFKNLPIKLQKQVQVSDYFPFNNFLVINISRSSKNYDTSDLSLALNEINNFQIENEIVICKFVCYENNSICIFLMKETMFIINIIYFQQLTTFFSHMNSKIQQNKFFFVSENNFQQYKNILTTELNLQCEIAETEIKIFETEIKNFIYDFNQNSFHKINSFDFVFMEPILGYIIKQSYITTQENRQKSKKDENNIIEPKFFKLSDFIYLRDIYQVKLYYSKKSKQLYVLKFYEKNNFESRKLYKYEKESFKLIGNWFPYINKCVGRIKETKRNVCLITNYVEGKTLDHIKEMQLTFDEKVKIIFELMISIEYCHSKGLIIRDLKPNNIIIDSNHDAILFDFNNSRTEPENSNEEKTCFMRNDSFLAPEQNSSNYTFKVDIYSLGALAYFIIKEEELKNTKDPIELPYGFDIFYELIQNSIVDEPEKRHNILKINTLLLIELNGNVVINKIIPDKDGILAEFLTTIKKLHIKILEPFINGTKIVNVENTFLDGSYILFFFGYIEDNQNSRKLLKLSAKMNNTDAMYILGLRYKKNNEINKAIKYLKRGSDLNSFRCQSSLGILYKSLKQIEKCLYYFNLAADQGCIFSHFYLGSMYFLGVDVEKDYQKAIDYLTLPVKRRHKESLYVLSQIYIYLNDAKCIEYLEILDDLNFLEAKKLLGALYYQGKFVKQDKEKAYHYLSLSATHNNDPVHQIIKKCKYCDSIFSILKRSENQMPNNNSAINNPDLSFFYAFKLNDKGKLQVNYDDFKQYFKISADHGNQMTQYFLGIYYFEKENDIQNCIKYLTLAANQNYPKAHYSLFVIYHNQKDYYDINKAFYHLQLAAEQNDPDALYDLGISYCKGYSVPKNINKGIDCLTRSAKLGKDCAQYNLGVIYYNENNFDKAIYYLNLASQQKYYQADGLLGQIYTRGIYVPVDINKAMYHLEKAANHGNSNAFFWLGYLYFRGEHVEKDIEKAIHYLTIASEQKHSQAQYFLGLIYIDEEYNHQNIEKALHYLKLSASLGNSKAKCQLGIYYSRKQKSISDHHQSIDYLRKSANQNDPNAQYHLGVIYLKGEIVPQDIHKSLKYLELSAKNRNYYSYFLLGYLYYSNICVPRDISKSIHYYIEASNTDDYHALNNLGVIFKRGEGIEKNIPRAISFFEKAIKISNDSFALYNLACIYYFDKNFKNTEKAVDLLVEAANNGIEEAENFLGLIELNNDSDFKDEFADDEILHSFDFYEKKDFLYFIILNNKPVINNNKQVDINSFFYEGFGL